MLKLSVLKKIASTVVFLLLTACTKAEYFDYRGKGEPATLEDIIGVWDNPSLEANSEVSEYIVHVVIREDSTYHQAVFFPESFTNDPKNCFSNWESTITELGQGEFLIGDEVWELYLYKDELAYYRLGGKTVLHVYNPTTHDYTTESSFLPDCYE